MSPVRAAMKTFPKKKTMFPTVSNAANRPVFLKTK